MVRVPKGGGKPILIAADQGDVDNLLVDGGRVYWLVNRSVNVADPSTWKVTTVAEVSAPGYASYALDSRYVYIAPRGNGSDSQGYTGGSIWRACKPAP